MDGDKKRARVPPVIQYGGSCRLDKSDPTQVHDHRFGLRAVCAPVHLKIGVGTVLLLTYGVTDNSHYQHFHLSKRWFVRRYKTRRLIDFIDHLAFSAGNLIDSVPAFHGVKHNGPA